jgi:hypothetical protein
VLNLADWTLAYKHSRPPGLPVKRQYPKNLTGAGCAQLVLGVDIRVPKWQMPNSFQSHVRFSGMGIRRSGRNLLIVGIRGSGNFNQQAGEVPAVTPHQKQRQDRDHGRHGQSGGRHQDVEAEDVYNHGSEERQAQRHPASA